MYLPECKRMYHGGTRDWITNEIFRRVEPSGRTMGEVLAQDLRNEFKFDILIGANDEDLKLFKTGNHQGMWSMTKMSFKGPEKSYANVKMGDMGDFGKDEEMQAK